MIQIKTLKQARSITGGISNRNRKMPFYSYGLPVKNCITGSKLSKIKVQLVISVMLNVTCIILMPLKPHIKKDLKELNILILYKL